MTCANCQSRVGATEKYCPVCGRRLQNQTTDRLWAVILVVFVALPLAAMGTCFFIAAEAWNPFGPFSVPLGVVSTLAAAWIVYWSIKSWRKK